jgi:hypothetical protein
MDMYRDSYVVALLLDGKIQKESDDGTVLLPFGSEYVLRLKNKLRKRAVADVWIDGKVAAKGIVVDANGTVDLERFVEDGNLTEGKRFKLARLTDPKVDQPNDSENGSIEVNFYPEKEAPVVEKIIEHINCSHHNHGWLGHCAWCCNNNYCGSCHPGIYKYGALSGGSGITYTGGVTSSGNITVTNSDLKGIVSSNQLNVTYSSGSMNASQVNTTVGADAVFMNASNSTGEAAATVQGSTSLQKFSSIYIDVDRSKPTTIRLTVKGTTKILAVCGCGYKRKKDVKFCPNDGTQLIA